MVGTSDAVVGISAAIDSKNSVRVGRLDGTMSIPERQQVLDDLAHGRVNVLLATLGVGGLGLNLTTANHVVLLDAWFNRAPSRLLWFIQSP